MNNIYGIENFYNAGYEDGRNGFDLKGFYHNPDYTAGWNAGHRDTL